jgi:hypothetical protein
LATPTGQLFNLRLHADEYNHADRSADHADSGAVQHYGILADCDHTFQRPGGTLAVARQSAFPDCPPALPAGPSNPCCPVGFVKSAPFQIAI